jgi:hypothetical protein
VFFSDFFGYHGESPRLDRAGGFWFH